MYLKLINRPNKLDMKLIERSFCNIQLGKSECIPLGFTLAYVKWFIL